MRLDKWLWCARFYKTRGLAAEAIKTGKIRVNENRIRPSRNIKTGEQLLIRRGSYTYRLTILSLADGRKSPKDSILLYQEQETSIAERKKLQTQMRSMPIRHTKGRPTKRERRELLRWKS